MDTDRMGRVIGEERLYFSDEYAPVGRSAPGGASAPRRALGCPESDEGSEKRCVQAHLWQGVGVVAVYVYATDPDNVATGRPGRAGFSAKGST